MKKSSQSGNKSPLKSSKDRSITRKVTDYNKDSTDE